MNKLTIGTRGSNLALNQANDVKNLIEDSFGIKVIVKTIKTEGDVDKTTPIHMIPDKGFYTKEIEMSLLNQDIDIAVHSLKDLPLELSSAFEISAVLKRKSPMDILIAKDSKKISDFSENSIIAVGSIRRRNQLINILPNIKTVNIRGNIETRIKKIYDNNWDGLIVAKAAIERLALDYNYYEFTDREMIPAPCQGIVALETLKKRADLSFILKKINHNLTFNISKIEREIAKKMDGGCKIPIGCLAQIDNDVLTILTYISTIDGNFSIFEKIKGNSKDSGFLIDSMIAKMQSKGLNDILDERSN